MKKLSAVLLAGTFSLVAVPAVAADVAVKAPVKAPPPAPMFKVEYGGAIMTDYNFRGVSQSNRGPSAAVYATAVWQDFFYMGIAGAIIDWPRRFALSSPSGEFDFYAGIRPKIGKWSFDLGLIYYYYPKEVPFDSDFYEVYAKASYPVNDQTTIGAAIYYSPDYLNYSMDGTTGSLNAKWVAPGTMLPPNVGFYASAEAGRVWLGDTSNFNVKVPNYNFWNAGFGWTWKTFTLDLRYHDTDLSRGGCLAVLNGAVGGAASWCSPAFIAKLSFDTTTD